MEPLAFSACSDFHGKGGNPAGGVPKRPPFFSPNFLQPTSFAIATAAAAAAGAGADMVTMAFIAGVQASCCQYLLPQVHQENLQAILMHV
jgi:hypothetical protein